MQFICMTKHLVHRLIKCNISYVLQFKLSPDCEWCIISFAWFPSVWILCADVSEHSVCSIFIRHVNKKKCRHITFRCWGITQKKEYIIICYYKWLQGQASDYMSTILASLTKYIQVYALTLLSHLLTSDFAFSASGGIINFSCSLWHVVMQCVKCTWICIFPISQWKLKMHELSNEMWYVKNLPVLYTIEHNENKQTKNNTAHVTSRH